MVDSNFTSISKRFSYTLIAIITLVLIVFAAVAIMINLARSEEQLRNSLSTSLKLTEVALRIPIWNVDYHAVQGFVDALLLDEQVVYAEVTSDGDPIATNTRQGAEGAKFEDFEDSSRFMTGAIDIRHEDEIIGTLQLAFSRASIRDTVIINAVGILLLTSLIISAIAITSLLISRRYIAQPLSRLQHSASAIAKGDLEVAIDVRGHDEISSLARDLDMMRQSIKDLIRELQEDNQEEFRKVLDFCPAGLHVVDDDGFLIYHNQRFREMLGYSDADLQGADTRKFWFDLEQREEIIVTLRKQGGQLIDQEVLFKMKDGEPLAGLLSYTQVAYKGGQVGFAGGSRIVWLYDISDLKRAEEARLQSEQRLVDAIETIGDGFCLYDKDERLVLFNQRYKDGFPGNVEVIRKGASFEDIARAIAMGGRLKEAVGREEAWVQERLLRYRDPPKGIVISRRVDGRWMQISERITSEGGRVGTFTDVTELKRREEELARTTDRLQLALSMEGVGIWDVDLIGDMVWWSREYTEMMGHDPETYEPTPTTWEQHLHPDNADETIAKVDAFLKSNETVLRAPEHFVRADGSEMWVESLMRVQRSEDGQAIRLAGLDVDITEQLEREHELERVSERLSLAMSIEEVGIYDADFKANTLWWSPEYTTMLGHDPETFVPAPPASWEERLHPDSADRIIARMNAFIAGSDDAMRLQQHILRVDQQEIWVDSVMRLQRDERGEATRLTGLAVDITEQLKREQELSKANRFIMESLRYGSRIQSAMLPAKEAIGSATHDHFLIWEPRDIVGGDFFWYHPVHGGYVLIVGDCTGHGVPGAFMTLIACGLLDRMLQGGALTVRASS